MQCKTCNTMNDADALFCSECGGSLVDQRRNGMQRQRRSYWYVLLFVPVIIIAAAIGYYKYFLPDGVAAEVNGEAIRLPELDAAVSRMQKGTPPSPLLRYQALNELITERLVMQEAGKAGIKATRDEVSRAIDEARRASGLDDKAFTGEITELYGDMREYERVLERRIAINRLITENVVPRGADAQASRQAVNQWLKKLSDGASIRIALSEQMPGAGNCGCRTQSRGQTGQQGPGKPGRGCAMPAKKAVLLRLSSEFIL